MDNEIGIVVAFITRETTGKRQLVAFRKPREGTQLITGGIEDGETPENALLRVIREQSGLDVENVTQLDAVEQTLEGNDRVVTEACTVELEPGDSARGIARLKRGSPVEIIEVEAGGYKRVSSVFKLEDGALRPDLRYAGYLKDKLLTDRIRTYLFQVKTNTPTEDQWTYKVNDFRSTDFYWADMDVELIPPQQAWLDRVRDRLK
jgi:ADP-ribose pyrophosphatase YjhB (NUDIX family)